MKVFFKSHLHFFITALVILIVGIINLTNNDTSFDINVEDTYYVVPHFFITEILTILFLLAGLLYWLLRNYRLIQKLKFFHTIITIGSVFAYWTIVPLGALTDTITTDRAQTTINILWLLSLFTQPLFILNIMIGLCRGIKRVNNTKKNKNRLVS